MKRRLVLLAALAIALAAAPRGAEAQGIEGFGLGIVVGEPTGITARFMYGPNNFQAHAAWSFTDNGGFQISGDYLRSGLFEFEPIIGWYVGIGGRLKFKDGNDSSNNDDDDDVAFGIRIPLGVDYFLNSAPVEFFGEIVPIMDLIPETEFDLNGAVGVRYYF